MLKRHRKVCFTRGTTVKISSRGRRDGQTGTFVEVREKDGKFKVKMDIDGKNVFFIPRVVKPWRRYWSKASTTPKTQETTAQKLLRPAGRQNSHNTPVKMHDSACDLRVGMLVCRGAYNACGVAIKHNDRAQGLIKSFGKRKRNVRGAVRFDRFVRMEIKRKCKGDVRIEADGYGVKGYRYISYAELLVREVIIDYAVALLTGRLQAIGLSQSDASTWLDRDPDLEFWSGEVMHDYQKMRMMEDPTKYNICVRGAGGSWSYDPLDLSVRNQLIHATVVITKDTRTRSDELISAGECGIILKVDATSVRVYMYSQRSAVWIDATDGVELLSQPLPPRWQRDASGYDDTKAHGRHTTGYLTALCNGRYQFDKEQVKPTWRKRTASDTCRIFWTGSRWQINAAGKLCYTNSQRTRLPPRLGWEPSVVGQLPAPIIAYAPVGY